LAPSPIAKVIISGSSSFISLTTSAFYPGDTLQQMTASHDLEIFKKFYLKSSLSRMIYKADASIRTPFISPLYNL
jgi:hypothetical protein